MENIFKSKKLKCCLQTQVLIVPFDVLAVNVKVAYHQEANINLKLIYFQLQSQLQHEDHRHGLSRQEQGQPGGH